MVAFFAPTFLILPRMKDTFYFSHDYNARTDEKVRRLLRKHGMAGYGVFWALVEDLYQNANALQTDCEGIAFELRVDCELVRSVIYDFGLFMVEGDTFGSLSVEKRLEQRKGKSQTARENALIRWAKVKEQRERDANALQTDCEGNAIKERKGNERKKNESKSEAFSKPDELSEFDLTLKSFFEMRVKIKKPATERAKELILSELDKLAGSDESLKIQILNQSIRNCWQDVYPLKDQKSSNTGKTPLTEDIGKMDYSKTTF